MIAAGRRLRAGLEALVVDRRPAHRADDPRCRRRSGRARRRSRRSGASHVVGETLVAPSASSTSVAESRRALPQRTLLLSSAEGRGASLRPRTVPSQPAAPAPRSSRRGPARRPWARGLLSWVEAADTRSLTASHTYASGPVSRRARTTVASCAPASLRRGRRAFGSTSRPRTRISTRPTLAPAQGRAQRLLAVAAVLEHPERPDARRRGVAGEVGEVLVDPPQPVPRAVLAHQPGAHDGAVGVDDPLARRAHRAVVVLGVGDLPVRAARREHGRAPARSSRAPRDHSAASRTRPSRLTSSTSAAQGTSAGSRPGAVDTTNSCAWRYGRSTSAAPRR